jgi:hypothetical protein
MAEDEIDIILDDSMGTFFPYYAKRSRSSLFDSIMKKQNSDMHSTSAIPLFGLTEIAQQTIVKYDIHSGTLLQMIYDHPNVKTIKKTASSIELRKYMILGRDCKEDVEEYIDALLQQIPINENQTTGFSKPQRGGNKFKQNRIKNIKNYLDKLKDKIQEDI